MLLGAGEEGQVGKGGDIDWGSSGILTGDLQGNVFCWQVQADGSPGKSFQVDTGHDLSAAQHLRSDPVRRSAQPDRNDVHLTDELHR